MILRGGNFNGATYGSQRGWFGTTFEAVPDNSVDSRPRYEAVSWTTGPLTCDSIAALEFFSRSQQALESVTPLSVRHEGSVAQHCSASRSAGPPHLNAKFKLRKVK